MNKDLCYFFLILSALHISPVSYSWVPEYTDDRTDFMKKFDTALEKKQENKAIFILTQHENINAFDLHCSLRKALIQDYPNLMFQLFLRFEDKNIDPLKKVFSMDPLFVVAAQYNASKCMPKLLTYNVMHYAEDSADDEYDDSPLLYSGYPPPTTSDSWLKLQNKKTQRLLSRGTFIKKEEEKRIGAAIFLEIIHSNIDHVKPRLTCIKKFLQTRSPLPDDLARLVLLFDGTERLWNTYKTLD